MGSEGKRLSQEFLNSGEESREERVWEKERWFCFSH